jgi:hypothetical protein
MTDWNAVTAFMREVVAWPTSSGDVGHIQLINCYVSKKHPKTHGRLPGPNGKYPMGDGTPYYDVSQFVAAVARNNNKPSTKDQYFCTARCSLTFVDKSGYTRGKRGAEFSLLQKAIWVDIDVGETPRAEPAKPVSKPKYKTVDEAMLAILKFTKAVSLPMPSAIVRSGGGIHVYWISKTSLTPAEWQPYASGLKNLLLGNNILCDSGLTTDIARILRIPGSFNHKLDTPRPCELEPLPLKLYDFKILDFLKQFAGPVTAPGARTPVHNIFANPGMDFSKFGKPAFNISGEPGLEAGIDKFADTLLKAEPIFDGCGFLREARANGGADYKNPLWNLSVLCSAFMENGNAIAHEISRGHATYTHAETQQHFERKIAEKDRGVGRPSCAAIRSNGCSACAACPHFGKITSPLNLGTKRPEPNQGNGTAQQAPDAPHGPRSYLPEQETTEPLPLSR